MDTGAAVTLLRDDTWERVNAAGAELKPWNGQRLVGVEGSPLQVRGCTRVDLDLSGETFQADTVVVSPLSTEAILGLDFLLQNAATIDLEKGEIRFAKNRICVPLQRISASKEVVDGERMSSNPTVCVVDTVNMPPHSEMEVMATVRGQGGAGPWLLEGVQQRRLPVVVARALVEPRTEQVPVRFMNPRAETVVIAKDTVVATLEQLDSASLPDEVVAAVDVSEVPPEKREMLTNLVESNGDGLTAGEKEQFLSLLLHFSDVFASSEGDLGRTSKLHHRIETTDAAPVRQAVRRLPPARREEVRGLLGEMLEKDVIQPSVSPWASPIVLVKKKDGSTRFCVDYRKLNELTRKDAYPLPRIDTTLDTLAGSRWFSTLDLLSGYWQVELAEEDRQKSAFCTTEGLYEFKVMPFGLCNAPATFQRLMDLVLAGLQWSHCLVYIDDVVVLGGSFSEHLQNLQAVFVRLRKAGLKLKPKKCAFFQTEVSYLGHIISRDGVSPDPAKVDKVAKWPTPNSARAVQQFLGFANYYRRFIRDFAQIAKPLHKLTERGATFAWTEACEAAFTELRQRLTTAPLLAFPDFSRTFILDTDASEAGIGAVLSQVDDEGRERVIAYASRVLSKPERRYCVTRKELLAVVVFTTHFRPYLIGRRFTLRTDHGSLTWLRNFREPEGQLARWLEKLQELDFDILHRRGRKHTNADALSRLPCNQCGRESHHPAEDPNSPLPTVLAATMLAGRSSAELRQLQVDDPTIGPVIYAIEANQKPGTDQRKQYSSQTRKLFSLWNQLVLQDSVLYRHFISADGLQDHLQLVTPQVLQAEILEDLHGGAVSGHLGEEKTLGRLKQRFYWPGHWNAVRDWCRTCSTCAARKTPSPKCRAAMQPVQVGCPMQVVAVDILGPLPESKSGNSYLLVTGDYFTRYMEAFPIPNQEAVTIARTLVDGFFCRFGMPEQLHSDQGKQFESELLKEVCAVLRINKTHTTPYHPQSDGLIERYNRTLLSMLSTCAEQSPFHWEDHVQKVCLAYNTSVQATTGFTPFYLMFGREARLPIDFTFNLPTPATTTAEYASHLADALNQAYASAREKIGHNQNRQKEVYDKKIHGEPHSEGDLVWLHNPHVPRGTHRKFHKPWTGPHRVLDCISDQLYRIEHVYNKKKQVVHFDRLKPCDPQTRFPTSPNPTKHHHPTTSESQPSVGTSIEVLDPVDVLNEHSDPPLPPRYPLRSTRRPPDRYAPIVEH